MKKTTSKAIGNLKSILYKSTNDEELKKWMNVADTTTTTTTPGLSKKLCCRRRNIWFHSILSSMMSANITAIAYIKIFLHAAKNPSSHIGGFVIGKFSSSGDIEIIDVLPICHSSPCGPMFDIAGEMVCRLLLFY